MLLRRYDDDELRSVLCAQGRGGELGQLAGRARQQEAARRPLTRTAALHLNNVPT